MVLVAQFTIENYASEGKAPAPAGFQPDAAAAAAACVEHAVLSARLGTGKGGLSWASEEQLQQSLQVRTKVSLV
jgi:hypothetical protein